MAPVHTEIEVLIVDNEPSDKVKRLCLNLSNTFPVPLHYLVEPNRGISQARNTAIEQALHSGADSIVFMDDDDLPGRDWLNQLLAEHQRSRADIVFGTWSLSEDLPQWVRKSGIFDSKKISQRRLLDESSLPKLASTCNVLISCHFAYMMKVKGMLFDPELGLSGGEDKDFFLRAHAQGATFSCAKASFIIRGHQPGRYQRVGIFKRGFKNGSSRMGRKRRHENDKSTATQLINSILKLLVVLSTLPFSIFSRPVFMHQIYRLGKASGVLYGFFVQRDYAYYGKDNKVLK